MTFTAFRARTLACALLATTAMVAPVLAQESSATLPPVRQFVDMNGVDLFAGSYRAQSSEVSIGADKMGLSFQRDILGIVQHDSLLGEISISGTVYTVTLDNRSEVFVGTETTSFTPRELRGSSLTYSNGIFTYRRADGAVATFEKPVQAYNFGNARGIALKTLTDPSGKILTFFYSTSEFVSGWDRGPVIEYGRRLSHVVSSTGYRINFTYQNDFINNYNELLGWFFITKVVAYNTLDPDCVTSTSQCLQTKSWPTLSIGPAPVALQQTYTDSIGRTTTYKFNGPDIMLSAIQLPGSAADDITLTYNANHRVASVTAGGVTTTYAYADANGVRTVTVTRETGPAEEYRFDIAKLQLLSHKDATGGVTQHEYDASARRTKTIYPEGNAVSWEYDTRGNVIKTTYIAKANSGVGNLVSTATYPACTGTNWAVCNKPTAVTDVRGQVTNYEYDPTHGGVTIVTAPPAADGVRPQTRYTYTQLGNTGTASSSGVYRLTGTSTCQTLASCAGGADEVKTTIGYGLNLLPTTVTQAAGNGTLSATVTQAWDVVGNLVSVDGPLAGTADVTRYRYNAARERIGEVGPDPDGGGPLKHRATRLQLDARGLVSQIEAGTVTDQSDAAWSGFTVLDQVKFDHDTHRRRIKETLVTGGATQGVVQYSYDGLGRLDCTAQRMNPAAFGNLPADACTLGAAGSFGPDRITKQFYDAAGRVTEQQEGLHTPASASTVRTTYTPNGQVETLRDAEGNTTTYEYDGHGRLVKTRFPLPTKGSPDSSTTDYEQLTYHHQTGDLISRKLRDGKSIGYGYDNLGRLTLKDLPGAEPDVTYTYDNLNRPRTVSQTGHTLTNSYDALGRLVSQTGAQGTVSYAYDLAGRRTQLTYPGSGLYINYDYLVTGEVTRIRENGATSGAGVLAAYAYDDRGRRTSVTRGNGTVTTYAYDSAQRLSRLVQNLGGTSHDLTLGFGYNPADQITATTRSNEAYAWREHYNVNRSYTTNGLNQYTASGPVVPSYDGRGNLTQAGPTTYTYSSENLLTSASGGITLSYDPLMRLHQTTAGGVTTRLAYDGQDLIAEYNGSNTLLRRYVHGPGVDEPIVWYEGAGTTDKRWLHADERGSIIAVTNTAGTALATNTYDEYGIPGSLNLGRFQYTGQTWLPELGLYYYKARVYSATLGRFLQTDPIGYADGMNLYAYVGNDPINAIDPKGTDIIIVTGRAALHMSYGFSPYVIFYLNIPGITIPNIPELAHLLPAKEDSPAENEEPEIVVSARRNEPLRPVASNPMSNMRSSVNVPQNRVNKQKSATKTKYDPNVNYCGGDGSVRFPNHGINQACYNHDVCYSGSGTPQTTCDSIFIAEIYIRRLAYGPQQGAMTMAALYGLGVTFWGGRFYVPKD